MNVSKNRGGPAKWMVYNGQPLLKWMIWGTSIFGNTHMMIVSFDNSRHVNTQGGLRGSWNMLRHPSPVVDT